MESPVTKLLLKPAKHLGIKVCMEFNSKILVPEPRIRDLCSENKCGNYLNNYMCPPYAGSLSEIEARLQKFHWGVLLRYSKPLNVKQDIEGLKKTKIDFHNKILEMEEILQTEGINPVWGMIGGNCGLCDPCKAKLREPCKYPDKARMSLESIAVDVLSFLDGFDLDNKFYPDKIVWTGCILF